LLTDPVAGQAGDAPGRTATIAIFLVRHVTKATDSTPPPATVVLYPRAVAIEGRATPKETLTGREELHAGVEHADEDAVHQDHQAQ
jgi:hypothetical protein